MDDVLSKGERTRAAILDAAYDLFIEQGFAATSMRDIAGRAGLAPGSLYNHFSSKEELAAEAFDYAWKSAFETRMQDLE